MTRSRHVLTRDDQAGQSELGEAMWQATCAGCDAVVGQRIDSLTPGQEAVVRLAKHSTYPDGPLNPVAKDKLPRYSVSHHISADLLERSQAQATHRFAIADEESDTLRILVRFVLCGRRLRH